MKIAISSIMTLLFCFTINAQNKNVVKETKTTILKVNNGTPTVKTEETEAVQAVETEASTNHKNVRDVKNTPVQITKKVTLAKDGKIVETLSSLSSLYSLNNKQYEFTSDGNGYKVGTAENGNLGILRKTPNNNWIYKTKDGGISFGFFDADGNLVLERYDENTDNVVVETFTFMK